MDPGPARSREARIGARTAALLILSGAISLLTSEIAVAAAGVRGISPITIAVFCLLAALGVTLWFVHSRMPYAVLVGTTLLMVLTVLGMDLYTADVGGGAQVAFLFPVVYAGTFLRPPAAWTTAVLTIVCEAVLTFTLLPVQAAVTDTSFVLFATIALTAVLTAAGRRQRELVAQLERLVAVDSLTGLATRRDFEDRSRRALEAPTTSRRTSDRTDPGTGVGMLIIDIDRFKQFNDAHGHPRGDAALVHVANLLRTGVRTGDTVARLGGDELAVLMVDIGVEELHERAAGLCALVRETPMTWAGFQVRLTVSIGTAHSDSAVTDAEQLYAAADGALYGAKRAGRDQVATGSLVISR